MNLSFDLLAVRRWAEFSGDFNPIHFDLAHAQKAGLDKLIVHGMLAVMPIKQMLSRHGRLAMNASTEWMKFKAAFRYPLAHDANHEVSTKVGLNKINFQLVSGDAHRIEHFRGSYGPVAKMPAEVPVTPQAMTAQMHGFTLDQAQVARFAQTYADISEYWVALDAVVFSQFMRIGLPIVEHIVIDATATKRSRQLSESNTDFNTDKVVVQTSHCVTVDAALDACDGVLHWALMPPVLLVHAAQVSGSVSLPVYRDDRLVMLVEIGLLAKVSPAPPLQ